MQTASAAFDAAMLRSHVPAVRVEVTGGIGQPVIARLDVTDGEVDVDSTRKVRRKGRVSLTDPTGSLSPRDVTDLLHPQSGHEIRPYRGVMIDGTAELLPLGVFRIQNPKVHDTDDGLEIEVSLFDRAKAIQRVRWIDPYQITRGTPTAAAVRDLLDSRLPGLTYSLDETNATVPNTVLGTERDNDPWDDALRIARADGMSLYFDTRGVVRMRRTPDPTVDPVVGLFAEGPHCTMISLGKEIDTERTYTGVVVTGEGSDVGDPVRAEAWLPGRSTDVPYFVTTSLVTTQAQAQNVADSTLRRVSRAEDTLEIEAVPDARLDADDVVRVERARSRVADAYVVSRLELPLNEEEPMIVVTDRRRA